MTSLQQAVGYEANATSAAVEPVRKLLYRRLLQFFRLALIGGYLVTPPVARSLLIGKQNARACLSDEKKLCRDLCVTMASRASLPGLLRSRHRNPLLTDDGERPLLADCCRSLRRCDGAQSSPWSTLVINACSPALRSAKFLDMVEFGVCDVIQIGKRV